MTHDLKLVVVPRELYYHEAAYVRGLEEALKPFAAVAEYEDNPPFWDETPKTKLDDDDEFWSVFYRDIRAKHFRAAREALKGER
jgi:hypothetical protein